MNRLRSFLFALIFYPGTVLYVLASFAALPFGRGKLRAVVDAWARFHRRCAALLLGIRSQVEGDVPTGPVLIAAKHQAMFETIELVTLLRTPAVVMKRELGEIPLWGRLARLYGIIQVDRSGGASALRRMVGQAREAIGEGRPIAIFPEGTRVAPGEAPPLQPGFAGLYRALDLPVVPLALDSG